MKKTVKRYNLSNIMKNAWATKKRYPRKSFGECLRDAWRKAKREVLAKEMPEVVDVMFNGHDLTINLENGEISGETYEARKHIKYIFAAKWDSAKKVWVSTLKNLRAVVAKECVVY